MKHLSLHIEYIGSRDEDAYAVVLEGADFLENLFAGTFKECLEYEREI
jgi:hypothetical protein